MKERPILFSAPMVHALLDGSKTLTRRAVKPVGNDDSFVLQNWGDGGWWPYRSDDGESAVRSDGNETPMRCPYGDVGDQLWVRETHRPIFGQTCGLIAVDYRADPRDKWERLGDAPDCLIKGVRWTPSIHMRREYSRILLEIVSVRVERLQDISEADCWSEGIEACDGLLDDVNIINFAKRMKRSFEDSAPTYAALWESINGPGSWEANPWVWVIEFKRSAS